MEYNSVYGVIKIDRDYKGAVAFIQSLPSDRVFPYITSKMFGLGDHELPYYYDNMLITFGTTYKYFGSDLPEWNIFILRMEHILRHIDFEVARFHIDSDVGECECYWVNKATLHSYWLSDYRKDEFRFMESEEFFFGFGNRSSLNVPYPDERYRKELDEPDLKGFTYPIAFSDEAQQKVVAFNKLMRDMPLGTKVKFEEVMDQPLDDETFVLVYKHVLEGYYFMNHRRDSIELIKHPHIML